MRIINVRNGVITMKNERGTTIEQWPKTRCMVKPSQFWDDNESPVPGTITGFYRGKQSGQLVGVELDEGGFIWVREERLMPMSLASIAERGGEPDAS